LNVNEWGVKLFFSTGFDMSADTAISIIFTKPDGTTLTVTNPADANLIVGTTNVTTVLGTFLAHQYLAYTFQSGDVDQAGLWSARASYTDATQHLISDAATFTVGA